MNYCVRSDLQHIFSIKSEKLDKESVPVHLVTVLLKKGFAVVCQISAILGGSFHTVSYFVSMCGKPSVNMLFFAL